MRGGLNTYGYVGGNPINRIDPTGEVAFCLIPGIGWTVCGSAAAAAASATAQACTVAAAGALAVYQAARAWGAMNESNDDEKKKEKPPGFWPADKGADEWGRRNGVGKKEGRRRFHEGKQGDNMSGAADDYWVDPSSGEVKDPMGEVVDNLNWY